MSDRLTAAGKARQRVLERIRRGSFWVEEYQGVDGDTVYAEGVRDLDEYAARAVDEALSVERVARALYDHILPRDHGQLCPGWTERAHPGTFDRCDCWVRPREQQRAAALVAHLRGPR